MSGGPSHVLARLHWPGSAEHLALVRIVVGGFMISVFLSPSVPLLLEIPAGLFPTTVTVFPLELEKLAVRHMWTLQHVGLLASLCMLLGLATRVAVPVLLGTYLAAQNYYYRAITAHDDWLYFTFFLLVLCFARCSDTWSIDAWFARGRNGPAAPREPQTYRWPIELMTVWLAIVYSAAGIAKLFPLRKGIVWLSGASAQRMAMYYLRDSPFYFVLDTTPFPYDLRWPFTLLSFGAVAIELSAIALLLSRRAAPYVMLGVLGMHFGIYCFGIMGFATLALVSSVVLLDPQMVQRLAARRRRHTPP